MYEVEKDGYAEAQELIEELKEKIARITGKHPDDF